jgi:hypothetical protein
MRLTGPNTVSAVLPMYSNAGPSGGDVRAIPTAGDGAAVTRRRLRIFALPQHMIWFLLGIFVVDGWPTGIAIHVLARNALEQNGTPG